MIRWLAVVAVMQEESCDTNLVCSLLPHTRRYAHRLTWRVHFVLWVPFSGKTAFCCDIHCFRWIKPRNYVALLEVLSSITDKDGDQVPVFLSRGNSTVPTTEFQ